MDLDVSAEVEPLVTAADLELLAAEAAGGYACLACDQPGRLPAAAVVLRDGDAMLLRLAHRECARSGVVEVPGLAAALTAAEPEARAVAALVPVGGEVEPVLLVEISVNVSTPAGGERVDAVVSWALQHGLHLVAALDTALDVAAGWRVELPGASALRVDGPGGTLFDGTVTFAPKWRRAVIERGSCGVLLGVGLRLEQAPQGWADALDRIAAVGRAGRLAGGLVAVARP
ncbi:hypothetical protein [Nonomuraea rhodomycinica]|uniref:Uncharacterized protein n=1 Tax=Nonomuraea rhodomycinica TaxID=1712872 RepID=A0A7Y6IZX1_9ACTN|nr:hypothetical protein [Nonomuraea rhodomycinica]NUW47003.1 hypothetical protein [Nonomuraea rhodomycinica]